MMDKTKSFVKSNVFFLVVATACLLYMARGFVEIVETGKTIPEILADGALSAIFGFLVSKLLSLQGIAKGEANPEVAATARLHGETVETISRYIDRLDEWCEMQSAQSLRIAQAKVLAVEGIAYDDFVKGLYPVTVEGEVRFLPMAALSKPKRKAIIKAKRVKLTPLTASSLTSDGGKNKDPYDFGIDKKKYEFRRDAKQWVSKAVCGLLFGYFGVKLIENWSWSSLIWTALQVAVIVLMGMISYLNAYFFVVDVDRHRVIRKIDILQKFEAYAEVNYAIQ